MRLGFGKALRGWRRTTALCPGCGSERLRYSRRRYEGLWPRVLEVRPVKCSACGSYFPISARAVVSRLQDDPVELELPFRPLELDGRAGYAAGGPSMSAEGRWRRLPVGVCPGCGSRSVRGASAEPSLMLRLDLKDHYRCVECNATFVRLNLVRLIAFGLLLFFVLGGLSYAVTSARGGAGGSKQTPRIKKGQIPPPPPPVFR